MFKKDDPVYHTANPGRVGFFTGNVREKESGKMIEVEFPNGEKSFYFEHYIRPVSKNKKSLTEQIVDGEFGRDVDLRRKMTFEKLRGTLSEFIYSMDAAEIDFMPYQYKPVLKFIDSPTERLLIADEVGLGKTIEAALVWQELQSRRDAKRLIVFCPKTLAENWRSELRSKFSINAEIVNSEKLNDYYLELLKYGSSKRFVIIATYSSVRGSAYDFELINQEEEPKSRTGKMINHWLNWDEDFNFADLVIFDEAHILRNSGSLTSKTAKCLSNAVHGILCVSATPINNSDNDLRTLLKILDPGVFENEQVFTELVKANEPTLHAINCLMQTPPQLLKAKGLISELKMSAYISDSDLLPIFENLLNQAIITDAAGNKESSAEFLVKAQSTLEQLNVLGSYISRTKRKQVKEMPAIRKPLVIAVKLTPMEARFYEAVTNIVRKRLLLVSGKITKGSALTLGSIVPQLRMSSCIPAMVKVYSRAGEESFIEDLRATFSTESEADDQDDENGDDESLEYKKEMVELIANYSSYNFEENDSKFKELIRVLTDPVYLGNENKIIIFSYFRGTIEYLSRRLNNLNIGNITLHGGISTMEERTEVIEKFRESDSIRVLISSEVGSEGINLQFSRVVINYDLPWNPMKIEQRIGRIDRVGQQAKVLTIVNFKVDDTVDGRVYELLLEKLKIFEATIGHMEHIIGENVNKLTRDLFESQLTPTQEKDLITQCKNVIIQRAKMENDLEESSTSLEGLSDFVRTQINRSRKLSRYVNFNELESYTDDFFLLNEVGNIFIKNYQHDGVFKITFSDNSYTKFRNFVERAHSNALAAQTNKTIIGTFSPDIAKKKYMVDGKRVVLVTHLSPLIRWITDELQSAKLYATAAMEFKTTLIPPGRYAFSVERWCFNAIRSKELLTYGIINLDTKEVITGEKAEQVYNEMLMNARTWSPGDINLNYNLGDLIHTIDAKLSDELDKELGNFSAENQNLANIQIKRAEAHYKWKKNQDDKRLETSMARRNSKAIAFAQSLARKTNEKYERILQELNLKTGKNSIDITSSEIAKGVFFVN